LQHFERIGRGWHIKFGAISHEDLPPDPHASCRKDEQFHAEFCLPRLDARNHLAQVRHDIGVVVTVPQKTGECAPRAFAVRPAEQIANRQQALFGEGDRFFRRVLQPQCAE